MAYSLTARYAFYSHVDPVVHPGNHEKLTPVKNDPASAVIPRRNVTDNLHLLIVAGEANVNFCRTILTAHVLGYPTPTLLLWKHTTRDPMIASGSQLTGITAAAQYFRSLPEDQADHLGLVLDGYDVWFQLPPQVLLERYKSTIHDANQALARRLGPAATTFNLSQDIIFGASKRCTPNEPYTVACYAVPESPLPRDLYGNNTDTVIGYSTWSSLRQQYLESGTAIGSIDSLRLAYGQASEKLVALKDHTESQGTDHSHGQAVWNAIFGEQEFQREVLRRKHTALDDDHHEWQTSMMEGTVVDDPINPSFTHETMEPGSGREYEYGIGLDYWSQLTQQTSNADSDAKFLYFNGTGVFEQLDKSSAFACPARVKGRLPDDIMRMDLHKTRIPIKEVSWSDMPLYTNLCLDSIPVIIHHNGAQGARKPKWEQLWMNRLPGRALKDEILRDPSRTFAVADAQSLTWRELCPVELDAGVFQGFGETSECNPDDTFILGGGLEQVEHSSEGLPWPFQIFKSSPARPPVVKLTQTPNTKLAPGLIFITLYQTEGYRVRMPGPIIFTDQGRLVWFGPTGNTANFRWQQLNGKPTLLFWMRDGPAVRGHGYGNITLLNQDYSTKTVLCPQYGLTTANHGDPHCEADLHEAHVVSSRNTIITTAYNATPADLSSIHGPADGWIWDSQFYELDPYNNSILFRWRASDHIPLAESRWRIGDQGSLARPYDLFHINSVVDLGDHYLVSSRHCWTIYLIDKQGNIVWRFAGDGKGDFGDLPQDARFRWQHDARPYKIGHDYIDISLFDNQNWGIRQKDPKSAAKLLAFRLPIRPISGSNETQAQVIDIIRPQTDYQSVSQGAFDNNLPGGNRLANWGDIPILTEFDDSGREIWSAEFGRAGEAHIYRGFKQEWHATPHTRPDLFVEKDSASRAFFGYVSWNGATDVEGWNIYAGLSTDDVRRLGRIGKKGFETKFNLPCWTRFAQVGAVERGQEVRRSKFFQVI
ncbi:Putative arylsulfotransferase [Septoria linicola]|uniref:Arylsulfotransferase n=1 Tax=Septoria linicola TaxID=215465 RepID=A0A9Q9EG74_9PEZI|nr:putative arylsulfotransferase [Septoria linicola]USW48003.1 Putative arylsulfotransferase [Septoria linicola]